MLAFTKKLFASRDSSSSPVVVSVVVGGGVLALLALSGIYYLYKSWSESQTRDRNLKTKLSKLSELLKDIENKFSVTSKIEQIRDAMVREMREGLLKHSQSSLQMIPSYVTKLPHGTETGCAYSLDIGGSNIRVLKVTLDGQGHAIPDELYTIKTRIPPEVQQSNAETLFSFVAEWVGKVAHDHDHIGFTFSFPVEQRSIDSGYLIKWTKGFTAEGVVNSDVVQLLNEACRRRGLMATANALVNDTVGTLLAGAYQEVNEDCCVGLILGTGSNACYVEKLKNIEKIDPPSNAEDELMIINMESGNFGSREDKIGIDLPLTKWDLMLDDQSKNRRHQLLEKQISGMYLGEIVRILLCDLIESGLLFTDYKDNIARLKEPYGFPTQELSLIENDETVSLEVVDKLLKGYEITENTLEERKFVKSVVRIISARAAMLSATQIAACLKQMEKENKSVVIAIDGSVYEKYPNFKTIMEETLFTLLRHNKVRLVLAKDGSGVGAALASFMMQKE